MRPLPSLGLLDWGRVIASKARFPTQRRRAKWRAGWQFERIVNGLQPGDLAIDAGANLGRYTSMIADTGATVYAFEPDPHSFAALRRTFDGRANVVLRDQAVGAEERSATLFRAIGFKGDPNKLSLRSTLYSSKRGTDVGTGLPVWQVDLVALIEARTKRVALLKLDIEGSEVPVLERLLDTGVIDKIDFIFAETHERQVPELAERVRALRERFATEGRDNITLDWA
jgi:FkbM family methyltransferase